VQVGRLDEAEDFAADRNPLQYKAVPVTEYVLVYRKKSDKLIDWYIRNHPNQDLIRKSKIKDGYEKTNVWKIHQLIAKNILRYFQSN